MPGKYIYDLDNRPPGALYWRNRTAQARHNPKEIIPVNKRWEIERICRRIRTCGEERILILY